MPVMAKGAVPEPKVEIFQINDVSAYPGIEGYRVRYVIAFFLDRNEIIVLAPKKETI